MTNSADQNVNLQAERAVLGALLIDPDAIEAAADVVTAGDFKDLGHQLVYAAAETLHHQGAVVDYVTMQDQLGKDLIRVGNSSARGAAYLTELINATPSSMRVLHYARIVQRLGTLRRMMDAIAQMAKLVYNANGDEPSDIWDRARRVMDAAAPPTSDEFLLMWLDSLDAFFNQQLDRCAEIDAQEAGEAIPRAVFPWKALQKFSKYARPNTLTGLIAPPGVGKTAFCEGCAEHWAQAGLRVVFFHLELSHRAMLDRRMCRQSGVAFNLIEDGSMNGATAEATERMRAWSGGIHYVHCPGWSAARIVRTANRLHDRGQCDAMIVDYLQKMRRDYSHGLNSAQALGRGIELLKNCAEDLGIPVVLPAQYNAAGKKEKIKTSQDVRDTGELEDKANLVITLDRELLTRNLQGDAGEVIATKGTRSPFVSGRVDKNTFGACGPFELLFLGPRFMLSDKPVHNHPPLGF